MTNFKMIAGALGLSLIATPAMANSSVSVYARSSGTSSASGTLSAGVSSNGTSFVSGSVSVTGNATVSATATAGNKTLTFNEGPTTIKSTPVFTFIDLTPPTFTFDFEDILARFAAIFGR